MCLCLYCEHHVSCLWIHQFDIEIACYFIIGHIRGEIFFCKKLDFFVANPLIFLKKKITKIKRLKKNPLKIATFLYMVQVGSKKNTRMFPNKVIVFFLLPNLIGT